MRDARQKSAFLDAIGEVYSADRTLPTVQDLERAVVGADAFLNRSFPFLFDFDLCLSKGIFDDDVSGFRIVADGVPSFPSKDTEIHMGCTHSSRSATALQAGILRIRKSLAAYSHLKTIGQPTHRLIETGRRKDVLSHR